MRADRPSRALHTLHSDVLVGKTPVISSARREVTTSTVPRTASRPHHTVHAQPLTRAMLCTVAHTSQSHEHVLVVSCTASPSLLSTIFTLSFFLCFFDVVPLFLKGLKGLKKFRKVETGSLSIIPTCNGRGRLRASGQCVGARPRAGVWARGCGRVAALVRV